jgi:hypothetical protein
VDVAHEIAREAELDRLITRRHEARVSEEGDRLEEELYMDSVRRFHERSEAEMRHRWIDYHRHLQILHQSLADEHEAEAQKLREPGLEPDGVEDRGEGIR